MVRLVPLQPHGVGRISAGLISSTGFNYCAAGITGICVCIGSARCSLFIYYYGIARVMRDCRLLPHIAVQRIYCWLSRIPFIIIFINYYLLLQARHCRAIIDVRP